MKPAARNGEALQREVMAFLRTPRAWGQSVAPIEVIETHGAMIVMAGEHVLKVRRAVCLPYLDFSTLEARRVFGAREIELNARHVPGLYRGLIPITREADGQLATDGEGEVVEWAVAMARFEQSALLSSIVERDRLSPALAKALADAIFAYHATATRPAKPVDAIAQTARAVLATLMQQTDTCVIASSAALSELVEAQLAGTVELREERTKAGCIRRCHGDLHLGNIVLWQGRPALFDALEFDEALATIDPLYDLAFLLMDLDRRGTRTDANAVLNRYLWRSGADIDVRGLAVLPLFLGVRAAIRAMVALDRARLSAHDTLSSAPHALETLAIAKGYLTPPPPRLVAIGGFSGSGKTTVAAALAPAIGAAPGALHVRSDLERKRLAGIDETERLPASAYTAAASRVVYTRVLHRAELALAAGHSVVVDAVFARPDERAEVEALGRRLGVSTNCVRLEAPAEILRARVSQRVGDASDATAEVVDAQVRLGIGEPTWRHIDASGSIEQTIAATRTALRCEKS